MKRLTLSELTIAVALFFAVATSTVIGTNDEGQIGPVDSLTFSGEEELTIANVASHLSWGEEATSKAWSIGFMETGKALAQLLQADHFTEAREELNAELEENMSEVRSVLDALREEGNTLKPNSPDAPEFRQRWERTYNDFQQMQKMAMDARATLLSTQMKASYGEIVEAVNVIAERQNIDMVLRFIPPDREFEPGTPDSTMMQIRLRTALRLPDGINITDDVLAELGLDAQ